MSVNERMSGFLFLFLKRVRINLAQDDSQARKKYGHNGSKFVRDMNNRKNCRRYRWNFTDVNKFQEFKNSHMDISVDNPAEIKSYSRHELQGNSKKKLSTNISELFGSDQKQFCLMGFAQINRFKIQLCVVRALFALRADNIYPGWRNQSMLILNSERKQVAINLR